MSLSGANQTIRLIAISSVSAAPRIRLMSLSHNPLPLELDTIPDQQPSTGSVSWPTPCAGALKGKNFVIGTTCYSIEPDRLRDLIRSCGGRVFDDSSDTSQKRIRAYGLGDRQTIAKVWQTRFRLKYLSEKQLRSIICQFISKKEVADMQTRTTEIRLLLSDSDLDEDIPHPVSQTMEVPGLCDAQDSTSESAGGRKKRKKRKNKKNGSFFPKCQTNERQVKKGRKPRHRYTRAMTLAFEQMIL